MKQVLYLFSLLLIIPISAQDLIQKIPTEANIVVSAKGGKFQESMTLDEFNKTKIGKKILKGISTANYNYENIEDTGFNFSENFYYYHHANDSIIYNCFWLPVNDSEKLEKFLNKDSVQITYTGNIKSLKNFDLSYFWDNEKLLIISGKMSYKFIHDSLQQNRYGFKDISIYDYYYPEDSIVMEKYSTKESWLEDDIDNSELGYTEVAFAVPASTPATADTTYIHNRENYRVYYNEKKYSEDYHEQVSIKDSIINAWVKEYAIQMFTDNISSIANNPKFIKTQNKDATISFYANTALEKNDFNLFNYSYDFLISNYLGIYSMYGLTNMNGNLFFNENNARFVIDTEIDEENIDFYKAVYKHKINAKFQKYIDGDKVIGFVGIAINSEEYLKRSPKWIANIYEKFFPENSDSGHLLADIFSLFLDEKAVAKVMKGDAILIINDIKEKEYSYTTYEYDDDYNATEIEKTKKGTVPDFLFIASSEDPSIIEKILNYLIKKKLGEYNNGIFSIDVSKEFKPIENLYFLIKDDLIFMGTSLTDMNKIKIDTYQGKISKQQKALFKSNSTGYFNPKNLVNKIPKDKFEDVHKLMKLHSLVDSMGEMYYLSKPIKGNIISGEAVIETKGTGINSLKYFFKLAEILSE